MNNPNNQSIPLTKKEKQAIYDKKYRQNNKEKINERVLNWKRSNKEKVAKQGVKWRQKYKQTIAKKQSEWYQKNIERAKKYRQDNKEKIAKKKAEYNKKNKEKISSKRKEYNEKNKEKLKKTRNIWIKNNKEKIYSNRNKRYKSDPSFKMSIILRSRLHRALKSGKAKKSNKTEYLLGCTFEEARKYLESLFEEGMSWDNNTMAGWHIDHIIPCASFDLTDIEEQKKCFHYANLRPLWSFDNKSKGSLFEGIRHQYSV